MNLRVIVLLAAFTTPLAAFADDWAGKGQAGLLLSQGNTEARSANAALDLSRTGGGWKHALSAATLYGRTGEITSAQRWHIGWQSDREITPRLFGFGALRYGRDKFSGFQYETTASAGLGYKFIDREPVKLTGQVGAGYRQFRPELITKNAAGAVIARTPLDTVGEAVMTAGLDYEHKLTATTSLTNKLRAEYGSSNTLLTDDLALAVKMSDKLAISLGLSVQDNSNPPAGLERRDTVETVNLVFSF